MYINAMGYNNPQVNYAMELGPCHFLQSGGLAHHFSIIYCVANIVTDNFSLSDTDKLSTLQTALCWYSTFHI